VHSSQIKHSCLHQLPCLNLQMKRRKWMQNEKVRSLEIISSLLS
jgi:uncharacterized membrane protein